MSINWVMLKETPHTFVHLPGETVLYRSPSRTSLALAPIPSSKAFTFNSSNGVVHLTTQRVTCPIVYTASERSPNFESLSCPITNILDSRVTAPFFGPNTWVAVLHPVPNGGLPTPAEIKLVFKDGGAFDFHRVFEGLKERISQAQQDGQATQLEHLEDLPAYEESPPLPKPIAPSAERPTENNSRSDVTPATAPPGYEEAQRESVAGMEG